jgi:hypothetical protein
MFMRIFSVAVMLTLAGCGSQPAFENKVEQAKPDDRIECAIGGAQDFTRSCALERGNRTALTLRHEDGGFRRLTLESDGTIDTADGADAITVQTLSDGRTEVTVGGDRYRLPSTL